MKTRTPELFDGWDGAELHSTRLFPKHKGADKYRITGIARRCDWVFLSDTREPRVQLIKQISPDKAPQTIFLSMRSPAIAIERFAVEVLPQLTRPFLLISGSEDATIPRQIDKRWSPFDIRERDLIEGIRNHPLLLHWWAENLDTQGLDRLSPLPLGVVSEDGITAIRPASFLPLSSRPLTALCAHRVRSGEQWALRKSVSKIAAEHWSGWACCPEKEIGEGEFVQLLRQHSFVICVEGGGLDPSPKAWLALLNGAVPVIRRTPATAAYYQMPVVYVEEWRAEELNIDRLRSARDDIITRFQSMQGWRERWFVPLTLDYWWTRICQPLDVG